MKRKIDFPKRITEIKANIIRKLVLNALEEDVKSGDITSIALLKRNFKKDKAIIFAKENGIVCGINFLVEAFKSVDKNAEVITYKNDGEKVEKGEKIAEIKGKPLSLLSAERTALNFLGFMSGISTKVWNYTKEISFSNTRLIDTRKTIPGMRLVQKYAVSMGGGYNHRYGLYDMILIKENHIEAVGGITEAVKRAKEYNKNIIVEIEINSLNQVEEVLKTEADIVMLDNMNNEEVKKAFSLLKEEKYVEVSGNVNKERLIELANIGVDFVSMGELTHTIKPLDISMLIE